MEVVARFSFTAVDLLLRALRLRQHHCARDGDVRAVSDRNSRGRCAAISRRSFTRVFLKLVSIADSLWNNSRADLFRRWLHDATYLVVARVNRFYYHDYHLERSRCWLVEINRILVTVHHGWIFLNTFNEEARHQGRLARYVH